MKSHSWKDVNHTTKIKVIAALPAIGGLIVAAALLSVLLIPISSSYHQPAMAQLQNTTGTNGTTTTTSSGTPTDTGAGQSACTPTQRGAAGGTNATSGGNTTSGTTETNATSTIAGGAAAGNQSTTSQVRLLIEEACIAAQNNNTQGILTQLNQVLNALEGGGAQGNTTAAISALDLDTTSPDGEEQPSVGSTSDAEGDDGADDGTGGNDRDGGNSTSSRSFTTTNSTNTTPDNGGTNANTPERGTAEQDSDCGGITVGGTSAADDYGCADPDAE
jgi:hypothetical protein